MNNFNHLEFVRYVDLNMFFPCIYFVFSLKPDQRLRFWFSFQNYVHFWCRKCLQIKDMPQLDILYSLNEKVEKSWLASFCQVDRLVNFENSIEFQILETVGGGGVGGLVDLFTENHTHQMCYKSGLTESYFCCNQQNYRNQGYQRCFHHWHSGTKWF